MRCTVSAEVPRGSARVYLEVGLVDEIGFRAGELP